MSEKTEEQINKENESLKEALSAFGSLDESKLDGLKKEDGV